MQEILIEGGLQLDTYLLSLAVSLAGNQIYSLLFVNNRAEYMSAMEAVKEAIWLKGLVA